MMSKLLKKLLHNYIAQQKQTRTKPPVRRTLRVRRTEQFMANG